MFLLGALLVLGSVALGYLAWSGVPEPRSARERVARLAVTEQVSLAARVSRGAERAVDRVLSRQGWRPFSATELDIAGLSTSVAALVAGVLAAGALTFLGLTVLGFAPFVALVLSLLVPVLAKVAVRWRVGRRRKAFGTQLGPLLQTLAASLRAGHSLPMAMDAASRDADAPMAEELSRVVNEYRLGRDLVTAMEHVAQRMDSVDFAWIAQAIEAQRETGGNLNEILDQVAETIRERHHIRQQVFALSAEGRMSAYILMALPVVIGTYYSFVASSQMSLFVATGVGKLILLACAVAYVVGGLWMRSIVRIEF